MGLLKEDYVQNGFRDVETKVKDLVGVLKENKAKHVEEYNKAHKVFENAKLAYAKDLQIQHAKKNRRLSHRERILLIEKSLLIT